MNRESSSAEKPYRFGPGAILALLILLALFIRILAALARPMIEMDETSYVRMAENLVAGRGPLEMTGLDSTNFSPLFPLLIAGVAAAVRDYVVSGYIVATVFGSLLLVPVYLLGRELAGRRAALMAAALVAVMPIYVDYSSRLYSENVYVFFLLMSVFFARHMLRGCRIPCSTLAGASLGLAYLANPSAVFYLVIFLVLALAVALRKGILPQMARAALVLLFFFAVYAAPYIFFLHDETGRWTYHGKAPGNGYAAEQGLRHNTVEWEREMLALTDDGSSLKLDRLEDTADPVSSFARDPGVQLRNLFRQAGFLYSEEAGRLMPLWLLPLLGLGLFASGWNRTRAAQVGYLLVMMTPPLLVLTVYNAYTRFFMPFVALALIWVAQGWEKMNEWGSRTLALSFGEPRPPHSRAWVSWAIGTLVLTPVLAFSASTVLGRDYHTGYREAGELLAAMGGDVPAGTRIMSRETAAAYYAGGELVILPYGFYEEVTAYARIRDVDYLVISRRDIDERRPGITDLLGREVDHMDWKLVGTVQPGANEETLVFQLDK